MYQDYVYQSILDMLVGFHKSQLGWEEYRLKVEPMLLEKWKTILVKCRAYGFLLPEITFEGKLRFLSWQQIIQKKSLGNRKFPQEQIERI